MWHGLGSCRKLVRGHPEPAWTVLPHMKFLEPAALFHYVDGVKSFTRRTWSLDGMCVLTAILLVAAISGGIIWHRRDLPL
jgi:hypothetical protein